MGLSHYLSGKRLDRWRKEQHTRKPSEFLDPQELKNGPNADQITRKHSQEIPEEQALRTENLVSL